MLQRRPFRQPAKPERKPTAWPSPISGGIAAPIGDVVAGRPKRPRAKNGHLLNLARDKPCLILSPICVGGTETTVACHGAGVINGKGLGYKIGDHLTAWGCYACNHYTDAYKGASKAEKEAAFMAGHERQVLEWQRIAAGDESWEQRAAQWALDQLSAAGK